ncbi:hypothetical protein CspHIS471_0302440 [Cutaneotrichosporon sp. HIS471]|nr:hypothetical protein CspHIS471_0302440 [Cutaneotrichosporon sp. HIS471]
MHAPLGVPHRQVACAELIQAIEECHARGMIPKFLGACNSQKLALNMCLRQERIDRTTRNREASKVRTRKKEEAWARLDAERAEAQKA